MRHEKQDKARELYTKVQLNGERWLSDIEGILRDDPYVVIGDFAYSYACNGYVYMTPLKEESFLAPGYRERITITYPDWRMSVKIPHECESDLGLDALQGLDSAFGDLQIASDIMRNHGVLTDTERK